jgi:competence protein ComEC
VKIRTAWSIFLLFLLITLALIGWGRTRRMQPGELRVTFLDVGQGDSSVIETPSGKVLVVDTGGIAPEGDGDEGERAVAPFLMQRGINRIDILLLTHPDADHIGGAGTLLERFPVGLLMENGQPVETPPFAHILKAENAHHVQESEARRGEEIDCGDGVTARVLSPTEEERRGPTNNASIVLRVQYGRTAFLLTGDAEADEETDIVNSGQPLACDVLKVGHHGSHTSTTPEFLNAAHPKTAVISVGRHNLYGHPSREVLERLQGLGARVYRTDRNGAVTCVSDGVAVRTEVMQP